MKIGKKSRYIWRMLTSIVLFVSLSSGCASFPLFPETNDVRDQKVACDSQKSWWYARFRWKWPNGEKPQWHGDCLLAHQIFAPVLDKFGSDISLWRFHRRASRDRAGRQFSFVFYCTKPTASVIFEILESNKLLKNLRDHDWIEEMIYDSPDSAFRPGIAGASDSNWPAALQNSWPYFIMGASRTWLELIIQAEEEILPKALSSFPGGRSLDGWMDEYKRVEKSVLKIWRTNGSHAFLHHLNAVFAYEPLYIYEKRSMSF